MEGTRGEVHARSRRSTCMTRCARAAGTSSGTAGASTPRGWRSGRSGSMTSGKGSTRGHARGSARSIPAFHLYDALRACGGYLERYGGHKYAAGLEIRPERIDEFREAFNARARAELNAEDLVPEVEVDLDIRLPEANQE